MENASIIAGLSYFYLQLNMHPSSAGIRSSALLKELNPFLNLSNHMSSNSLFSRIRLSLSLPWLLCCAVIFAFLVALLHRSAFSFTELFLISLFNLIKIPLLLSLFPGIFRLFSKKKISEHTSVLLLFLNYLLYDIIISLFFYVILFYFLEDNIFTREYFYTYSEEFDLYPISYNGVIFKFLFLIIQQSFFILTFLYVFKKIRNDNISYFYPSSIFPKFSTIYSVVILFLISTICFFYFYKKNSYNDINNYLLRSFFEIGPLLLLPILIRIIHKKALSPFVSIVFTFISYPIACPKLMAVYLFGLTINASDFYYKDGLTNLCYGIILYSLTASTLLCTYRVLRSPEGVKSIFKFK